MHVKGLLEMMFDVLSGWIDEFISDMEARHHAHPQTSPRMRATAPVGQSTGRFQLDPPPDVSGNVLIMSSKAMLADRLQPKQGNISDYSSCPHWPGSGGKHRWRVRNAPCHAAHDTPRRLSGVCGPAARAAAASPARRWAMWYFDTTLACNQACSTICMCPG